MSGSHQQAKNRRKNGSLLPNAITQQEPYSSLCCGCWSFTMRNRDATGYTPSACDGERF